MKRKWLDQNYYAFFGMNKEDINLTENRPFYRKGKEIIFIYFFELTELGRFGKRISEVLSSRRFQ